MGGKVLGTHGPARAHSQRRAARRRRRRGAYRGHRQDRCPGGHACHVGHRRTRPPFLTGDRTAEGFYEVRNGIEPVIARGRAYAPYADLLWVESAAPDLELARRFAEAIHTEFPEKRLAYNCSPSFNWKRHLDDTQIASFQRELSAMGYAFQFITLAGFHSLNYGMYELAHEYAETHMSAYVHLQEAELAAESRGYTATKHQAEVGTGYFDLVSMALNPRASTLALVGSTETEQF